MWRLKHISFKDFFSHEQSEYEFKTNACTLIVGENRDNGGNNGAGKSTIFEAIAVALTNKSLRDLRKESFINREAESCEIRLSMENDVLNSTLTICRKFFRGNKPVKVELIENGVVNGNVVSVDEANKRVFELIGISRDDLLRYFIISQDNKYTFFTAGDTEKKEVLNRITSADMINPLIDRLSADRKDRERQRTELNDNIITTEAKRETLQEQLTELEDENDDEEIEELENKIQRIKAKQSSTRTVSEDIKKDIIAAKKELSAIIVPDVQDLLSQRKLIRKNIDEIEQHISENKRIYRIAKGDLDGKIKCPECGAEFIQDSRLKLSVEETQEVIASVTKENNKLSTKADRLNAMLEEVKAKIDEAGEAEECRQKKEREIRRMETNLSTNADTIASYDRTIKNLTEEIKTLKENNRNGEMIKSLKAKIAKCDGDCRKYEKEKTTVEEELEMINYWSYYFGKAGFMTYLANRAVSVLEGTVNSYLQKFKSPLSVNINGFKVLRDGSVREKIEIFALENGLNAEAFMSKSGGERGRINLAGIISIQHLINMSTNGRGLDMLLLDESLNNLDTEGVISVCNVLENLGITVMMITQNVSSEFNNENKLLVVKENGVSRIL